MDIDVPLPPPPPHPHPLTSPLQPFAAYSISTSAWSTLQSLPLLITPRLIVSLCASEPRKTTDLEAYLCRTLGLTLLALAAVNLIFTGLLPIGPQARAADSSTGSDEPTVGGKNSDVAKACATVAVVFQACTAFYLYAQLTSGGFSFAFAAGLVGNCGLFCFGTWALLFAGDGRTSKTTGADKRTSNFPFENRESAREKKKESKGRKSILKSR